MRKFAALLVLALAALLLASGCGGGDGGGATPTVSGTPTAVVTPTGTATPAGLPSDISGKIAFNSDRDGNTQIYVMNADGSRLTRLTNNPAHDASPAWSPVP